MPAGRGIEVVGVIGTNAARGHPVVRMLQCLAIYCLFLFDVLRFFMDRLFGVLQVWNAAVVAATPATRSDEEEKLHGDDDDEHDGRGAENKDFGEDFCDEDSRLDSSTGPPWSPGGDCALLFLSFTACRTRRSPWASKPIGTVGGNESCAAITVNVDDNHAP